MFKEFKNNFWIYKSSEIVQLSVKFPNSNILSVYMYIHTYKNMHLYKIYTCINTCLNKIIFLNHLRLQIANVVSPSPL